MSNRVYGGRFKGNTDTHLPNDKFRSEYGSMKWNSSYSYKCPECDTVYYGTKMEVKIYTCPCQKEKG